MGRPATRGPALIDCILPAEVVAVETDEDVAGELFATEQAALGHAVERRRREFTTGRMCARQAFLRLGVAPLAVGAGRDGAPSWPAGLLGSITHCSGYRACAVARAAEVRAVGIDAEPHAALPGGVLHAIAGAEERRLVSRLQRVEPEVHWDRILFSAKESLYKALYPLGARRMGFDDAIVTVEPSTGVFHARLLTGGVVLRDRELSGCSGRWLTPGGLVLTAVTLS